MLDVGKHMSDKTFSADYPQYPLLKSLMVNPALPVEEKFYSTKMTSRRAAMKETLLLTLLMMMMMKQIMIVTLIRMILMYEMNKKM